MNRPAVWLILVIIPPLGIVLLWRSKSRILTKLTGSVAAILLVVLHLVLFWNLRLELNGGITRPYIGFRNPEKHNDAIEKLHIEERSIDASALQAAAPEAGQLVPEQPVQATSKSQPESPAEKSSAYWTEFRGPGRAGIYSEKEILTDWPSAGLRELWKRPVGGGYASVVVANGVIFTIEQRRNKEVVAAYDLDSGREKWIHSWNAEFREILGGNGPRATPVWRDGRLYALGATGELRCLDGKTGKRIWARNILLDNDAENAVYGMAASPLIVDDKIIVLPGGSGGKSVVAYNRLTGDLVWRTLDDPPSYISPQLVTLNGRRQIMVVTARRIAGLSLDEGKLLWEHPWIYQHARAAQPIVTAENRFFISAGYGYGAAVIEVSGKGDAFETRTVWANTRMKNKFGSSVLRDGFIYGFDEAILACIDASTGELKWKGGRYGYGQLLLASGHLVISTESGEIALVKASPDQFEEIARFPAIEGKTWNVPAIADGRLIVRNASEMACYQIGK